MRLIWPLAKCLKHGVFPRGAALAPDSVSQRLPWKHSCTWPLSALAPSAKAVLPAFELCEMGGISRYRNKPSVRAAVGPHLCLLCPFSKACPSEATGGIWAACGKPCKSADSCPPATPACCLRAACPQLVTAPHFGALGAGVASEVSLRSPVWFWHLSAQPSVSHQPSELTPDSSCGL